jgi:hypothetical protein
VRHDGQLEAVHVGQRVDEVLLQRERDPSLLFEELRVGQRERDAGRQFAGEVELLLSERPILRVAAEHERADEPLPDEERDGERSVCAQAGGTPECDETGIVGADHLTPPAAQGGQRQVVVAERAAGDTVFQTPGEGDAPTLAVAEQRDVGGIAQHGRGRGLDRPVEHFGRSQRRVHEGVDVGELHGQSRALGLRLFDAAPLGDVRAAPDHPQKRAVGREARRAVRLDPAPLAVVPPHSRQVVEGAPVGGGPDELIHVGRRIVGVHERLPPGPGHLIDRDAEELAVVAVHELEAAPLVGHPDQHGELVGHDAEALLALADRALQPQRLQRQTALCGKPLDDAVLVGGPLVRPVVVHAQGADQLAGAVEGGGQRRRERRTVGDRREGEVGPERGVAQRGRAALLQHHTAEGGLLDSDRVGRQRRSAPVDGGAHRQLIAVALAHDGQGDLLLEGVDRRPADLFEDLLLARLQARRIEQHLQEPLAAVELGVELLDLLGLGLELDVLGLRLLALLREVLGLLGELFRLLLELLVLLHELLGLCLELLVLLRELLGLRLELLVLLLYAHVGRPEVGERRLEARAKDHDDVHERRADQDVDQGGAPREDGRLLGSRGQHQPELHRRDRDEGAGHAPEHAAVARPHAQQQRQHEGEREDLVVEDGQPEDAPDRHEREGDPPAQRARRRPHVSAFVVRR